MFWCDRRVSRNVCECANLCGKQCLAYAFLPSETLLDLIQWMCEIRISVVSVLLIGLSSDNNCSSDQQKEWLLVWRNFLYWLNSVCYPNSIPCTRFVYIECSECMGMKWQRREMRMWCFVVALFTQLCLLGDSLFVVIVMQLHDLRFARLSDIILLSFIFIQ